MICTDCKFSGEPYGTRTCPHCFGKMTTDVEQAVVRAKALWADWVSSWFTIGMVHWLSISKQLPPKWAAIAMGYDGAPRRRRAVDVLAVRVAKSRAKPRAPARTPARTARVSSEDLDALERDFRKLGTPPDSILLRIIAELRERRAAKEQNPPATR